MNKDKLRNIICLLISVIIAIVAIKLFIWMLPIILIIILAMSIYNAIKRRSMVNTYTDEKSSEKNPKKTIVIDSEDD